MIHSGIISHTKIHAKTIKKTFNGFLVNSLGLCKVSNIELTGKFDGHSMFFGYTKTFLMSPAIPYPRNCEENRRNTERAPPSLLP